MFFSPTFLLLQLQGADIVRSVQFLLSLEECIVGCSQFLTEKISSKDWTPWHCEVSGSSETALCSNILLPQRLPVDGFMNYMHDLYVFIYIHTIFHLESQYHEQYILKLLIVDGPKPVTVAMVNFPMN